MSPEEEAVQILMEKGYDITTAESCTGGMIASTLINVSGISEIYREGYITYANEAKHKLLGVKEETLKAYGAVSEQTAYEMALGAAKAADARVSLAVTGIAGPGGGTKEKPVGLVYIGCNIDGNVTVSKNLFQGDRLTIRKQATQKAIALLLTCLQEEDRLEH